MQMCKRQSLQSASDALPLSTPPGMRAASRRHMLSWTSSRTMAGAGGAPKDDFAPATSAEVSPQARVNGCPRDDPLHVTAGGGSQFDDPASDAGVAVPEGLSLPRREASGVRPRGVRLSSKGPAAKRTRGR